ncbi:MAG: beta-galactosidase trimerization domain-containing protein [Burkholderiales bacterium]|nr:beta-galactosidase trimerization domain-containing protein [Burkholderiales bacterium]
MAVSAVSSPRQGEWWHGAHRVLLLNLREGDEPRVNAEELVQSARAFRATAFCISGGGIVAFYQTRIAGHRLSSGLQGRDLLAEIIPVAHREGMRVLARIDPSCAPKTLAESNPEWFARDREGRFCEVSEHYVTCPNADYYRVRMVEVVREILSVYGADGIWNNQGKFAAWDTGACYCDTCQTMFRGETGEGIPEENWDDPLWRRYNEWRYRRIADWVALMHREIHAVKRDAVFIAAVQLMESLETIRPGGWDIDYWLEHQDIPTFECQRRHTAPWWPGIQAKYLATLAPDKPRWMTVSYFYPWWRLYAAPVAENRPWIAQQAANGVSPWLHINGGYSDLFDRRSLPAMQDVFQRLERWQGYFDGARSQARVLLILSRHTQDNYGRDKPHARYLDFIRGWYCALQEAHIPFDVMSDKLITADRLSRYGAVIVSNLACVDDALEGVLQGFVAGGGGLVAGYDAGRFTLDGAARERPAFAGLLGIRYLGRREGLKSSYAKLEGRNDPLLDGIGDTDVIPNEGALIEVAATSGDAVPLTLIPPVIAHSGATISIPEYSAVRETTDIPVVLHGSRGKGRIVYFANTMEGLYYKYGFPDLGRVLGNAARWAAGGLLPVEVDAPDYVDVTHMAQPGREMVHLINLPLDKPLNTGWRHPGRNLVPVRDIAVRLRPARGRRVVEVRMASSDAILPHAIQAGVVEVVVPELADHEIVVFELGEGR